MMETRTKHLLIVFLLLLVFVSPNALAERLSVTASIANIRSGPGTGHGILWRVEKYYPLSIISKSGAWYYFSDYEGDAGWIHQSLVGKVPSVITAKPKSHVRSGPGMGYRILFSIENGVPFKVLERKGNWVHVRHGDGDQGWIHKSLLW